MSTPLADCGADPKSLLANPLLLAALLGRVWYSFITLDVVFLLLFVRIKTRKERGIKI
jgi:hypothetical protein